MPDGFLWQHVSDGGLGPLFFFIQFGFGFFTLTFPFSGLAWFLFVGGGFFGFCSRSRAFLVLFQSLGFGWVTNFLICGWLGTFCGWDLGFGSVWFILSIFG